MNQDNHLLALVSKETRELLQDEDTISHYTKSMTALGFILPDRKLKLNSIDNFRDPKEKYLEINSLVGNNIEILKNSILEDFNSKKDELKKLYLIACFCSHKYQYRRSDNVFLEIDEEVFKVLNDLNLSDHLDAITPNFGYNKDRMWEVYAENHTGVCLVFSKSQIKLENKDVTIKNLTYSKKFNEDSTIISNDENITLQVMDYLENKLFTKDFDYRDESEVRLMKQIKSEDDYFIDISQSLKAIIFGIDFNMNLISSFKNMVSNSFNYEIKFIKAKFRGDFFNYVYEEV